jgi:hypothetical protein
MICWSAHFPLNTIVQLCDFDWLRNCFVESFMSHFIHRPDMKSKDNVESSILEPNPWNSLQQRLKANRTVKMRPWSRSDQYQWRKKPRPNGPRPFWIIRSVLAQSSPSRPSKGPHIVFYRSDKSFNRDTFTFHSLCSVHAWKKEPTWKNTKKADITGLPTSFSNWNPQFCHDSWSRLLPQLHITRRGSICIR